MPITDNQRELLRAAINHEDARLVDHPRRHNTLIIQMSVGGTMVHLNDLQKLSKLLGTEDIYVETNELEDAPSCTIFCNNVSGEWKPLEPEERRSALQAALDSSASSLFDALNLMGEHPKRRAVFDAMRTIRGVSDNVVPP
ncbi:MAG: hypothetical protein O7G84_13640 [Gammaproteobacteria bacterium]|nr:hypothetical protein [Gammaproteobacteria bacterium]